MLKIELFVLQMEQIANKSNQIKYALFHLKRIKPQQDILENRGKE